MENKLEAAKQETHLEQGKSVAKKKFEASVALAKDLEQQALSIIVEDETTLAMATQTLSKIKELESLTEAKRKELKAPSIAEGKAIDAAANQVLTPLNNGLVSGKAKIKAWNDEQEAIKKKASEALNKKKEWLEGIINQIAEKADQCATPEACQKLIDSIEKVFPVAEKFGPYAEEAMTQKKTYLDLLKTKKGILEKVVAGSAGSTKALVELKKAEEAAVESSQEALKEAEAKQEVINDNLAAATTKSATRKTWKAEVVDEKAVPREWLMVDMDKINSYLKANKETMKSGTIVNGVKFYQDENVMIR